MKANTHPRNNSDDDVAVDLVGFWSDPAFSTFDACFVKFFRGGNFDGGARNFDLQLDTTHDGDTDTGPFGWCMQTIRAASL